MMLAVKVIDQAVRDAENLTSVDEFGDNRTFQPGLVTKPADLEAARAELEEWLDDKENGYHLWATLAGMLPDKREERFNHIASLCRNAVIPNRHETPHLYKPIQRKPRKTTGKAKKPRGKAK